MFDVHDVFLDKYEVNQEQIELLKCKVVNRIFCRASYGSNRINSGYSRRLNETSSGSGLDGKMVFTLQL